jgi:PAS domain S-box-containing protein
MRGSATSAVDDLTRELFRAIADGVPSPLAVLGPEGQLVWYNQAFGQALSSNCTLNGRTVKDVVSAASVRGGSAHATRLNGESSEAELTIEVEQDSVRTLRCRIVALPVAPSHTLLALDAERAPSPPAATPPAANEKTLRHASDLIVSMTPDGRISDWMGACQRATGLDAEAARGRSLTEMCRPEHRALMAAMLSHVVEGRAIESTDVDLITSAGQPVTISWNISPVMDAGGRAVAMIGIGRDLGPYRRLEEQLFQSAKMASLGVMASGIAHELRNPLGTVSAAAQLLREQPDDPQLRNECVRRIQSGVDRAAIVMDQLLRFAQPARAESELIHISDLLEQTLGLMAHHVLLHNITAIRKLQSGLPAVWGRPGLLQIVFTNLILNACDAMPHGGTLTLATRRAGNYVEAVFADTGQGIEPNIMPNIFDPFFTTRSEKHGTGLGLSISHNIVEQHAGQIEVSSTPRQGTTFVVRLPMPAPETE